MGRVHDVIRVQRRIAASPEAVFDMLADPGRHVEFDGGGSVRRARSGGRRLALGDRFGMDMKIGLPYSTLNTVVEFEENRRIAWQTRAADPLSRLLGGQIWGYQLEPVEGATLVTESWDITAVAPLSALVAPRMARLTRRAMAATLVRLEDVLTGGDAHAPSESA